MNLALAAARIVHTFRMKCLLLGTLLQITACKLQRMPFARSPFLPCTGDSRRTMTAASRTSEVMREVRHRPDESLCVGIFVVRIALEEDGLQEEEDEDQTCAFRNENRNDGKIFLRNLPSNELSRRRNTEGLVRSLARVAMKAQLGSFKLWKGGKMYLLCSFRFKSDAAFSI